MNRNIQSCRALQWDSGTYKVKHRNNEGHTRSCKGVKKQTNKRIQSQTKAYKTEQRETQTLGQGWTVRLWNPISSTGGHFPVWIRPYNWTHILPLSVITRARPRQTSKHAHRPKTTSVSKMARAKCLQ